MRDRKITQATVPSFLNEMSFSNMVKVSGYDIDGDNDKAFIQEPE